MKDFVRHVKKSLAPWRPLPRWVCGLVLAAGLGPASAITINLTYRAPGETLATFGTATAAPSNAVGGGSFLDIMNLAADYWEQVYLDPFVLNLEFGWFARTDSTAATHRLLTEGGTPHRELSGSIAFDSDRSTVWFVDPTPASAEEYTSFSTYASDLGGGVMNIGREFTGGSGNAARFDLVSTAIHEIGHALGLSSANDGFVAEAGLDADIDVLNVPEYFGAVIPLTASNNAHLNLPHVLMRPSSSSGVRRLISDADIVANAQISRFENVVFPTAIPEPAVNLLYLAGLAILLPVVRARTRSATTTAAMA